MTSGAAFFHSVRIEREGGPIGLGQGDAMSTGLATSDGSQFSEVREEKKQQIGVGTLLLPGRQGVAYWFFHSGRRGIFDSWARA